MRQVIVCVAVVLSSVSLDSVVLGQEGKTAASTPARNRLVRVVTVSQDGLAEKSPGATVDATLARLQEASAFQPDIACLPEAFSRGEAEPLPSPTAQRVGQWARKQRCYVVCPLLVRDGERVTNSALLIDRQGEVIGRYDKIRPTEGELKKIAPGSADPPVFQTDFGIIGIQICFDVNWHQQWQRLKEKGAQIVFFPAAYPAARHLAAHAWRHQYFVVSSTRTRSSSIFDITGEKLETTGMFRQWAGAVLPVGKRLFEIDFHVGKMRQIERKYGQRVRVAWYHDDDLVTLTALDPDLTVDDLISEFGLIPHTAYIERAQKAQDALRAAAASVERTAP
jgi:predicted amidohydrolase